MFDGFAINHDDDDGALEEFGTILSSLLDNVLDGVDPFLELSRHYSVSLDRSRGLGRCARRHRGGLHGALTKALVWEDQDWRTWDSVG